MLAGADQPRCYVLRPPRPGELGWVVQTQTAGYTQQYGWDGTYEAMVARIVADYAAHRDPKREAAWIAEVDAEPAGSVFCVRKSGEVAQLRLLYVDASARGLGIGARLQAGGRGAAPDLRPGPHRPELVPAALTARAPSAAALKLRPGAADRAREEAEISPLRRGG